MPDDKSSRYILRKDLQRFGPYSSIEEAKQAVDEILDAPRSL